MSYQFPNAPLPQRKRHTGRNILIGLGTIVVLIIALAAIGAATGGGKTPGSPAASASTPVPAAPAAAPAPAPTASPAGTYTGSCSYTLSSNFSESDAGTLTGEVDLTNTGNIGTTDHVRITWPQEGYGPVVMHRTVRVAAGGTLAVPFHKTASQDVISNLQNYQEGHNYNDGCTYKVVMTGTFGSISG